MGQDVYEAFLLDEMGYTDFDGVYLVPIEEESLEAARNQVVSGLTFDDLTVMWRAGVLPAYGTPHLQALVNEAIDTTMAAAEIYDPKICDKLLLIDDPKAIHAIWDQIRDGIREEGPTEWSQTVFETIRVRNHLYGEDWAPSPFEIKIGESRFFTSLDDRLVLKAVAWLEGDDGDGPINDPKRRHRDNGDWMLQYPEAWVIIHAAAFVPGTRYEYEGPYMAPLVDHDTGETDYVHLKRGRKPGV